MRRVQAMERLNDRSYSGSLDTVQFHKLLLEAGYSPEVAQRYANQRGWERLQAGVMI